MWTKSLESHNNREMVVASPPDDKTKNGLLSEALALAPLRHAMSGKSKQDNLELEREIDYLQVGAEIPPIVYASSCSTGFLARLG